MSSRGATGGWMRPRIAVAVALRPRLWGTALRQWARLVPRRWWTRRPWLPVPAADYLEFRLVTQYGGEPGGGRPPVEARDVVDYLEWCRREHLDTRFRR